MYFTAIFQRKITGAKRTECKNTMYIQAIWQISEQNKWTKPKCIAQNTTRQKKVSTCFLAQNPYCWITFQPFYDLKVHVVPLLNTLPHMRSSLTERHERQKLKAEKNVIKVWRYSECNIFTMDKERELGLVLNERSRCLLLVWKKNFTY